MINYIFEIDLKGEKTKYSDVVFTSGDKGAARFIFLFKDGNELLSTENLSLCIKAKRADGVIITDSGFSEGGRLCADIKNSMTEIPGELSFEIALSDETDMFVTTCEIITYVREGYGEAELEACDTTPILATLSSSAMQAEQSAKQAEQSAKQAEESAKEVEKNNKTFVVRAFCEDYETITADKTFQELLEAYESGNHLRAIIDEYGIIIETTDFWTTGSEFCFIGSFAGIEYNLRGTADNEWICERKDLAYLENIPQVDEKLSVYSENPVQNKVISMALGDVEAALDSILEIQNSLIGGE